MANKALHLTGLALPFYGPSRYLTDREGSVMTRKHISTAILICTLLIIGIRILSMESTDKHRDTMNASPTIVQAAKQGGPATQAEMSRGEQASSCVLPEPDYRGPETAASSIKGRILSIRDAQIIVETIGDVGQPSQPFMITDDTDLFTYYGGMVMRDELAIGQYVWVWFVGCDAEKSVKPPHAAIVMPFSLDPNDQPDYVL